MQKAQFNKATGAYASSKAKAQEGEDAAKAGEDAPAAPSKRSGHAGSEDQPAPVDYDEN
jgi:hypothetical protein